jgi:hypothetical protein
MQWQGRFSMRRRYQKKDPYDEIRHRAGIQNPAISVKIIPGRDSPTYVRPDKQKSFYNRSGAYVKVGYDWLANQPKLFAKIIALNLTKE